MTLLVALATAVVLAGVLAISTAGPTSAQPVTCGNGVLDVGEDCDLSSPLGAFCPPGAVCTSSCDCAFLATTTQPTTTVTPTTSSTTTTTEPDHFQCYEVKPATFTQVNVTAQDQFGTLQLSLRFPHRLCAPADKNQEGIPDPTEHLAGYKAKAPSFSKRLNQTVVNQFGSLQLDVVRPVLFLVPTSKDGVPITPPVGDHFTCYKVKRSHGAPKFAQLTASVSDQFQNVTETVIKPVMLCAPASKNNEDPTAPSHANHLLCYKAKSATAFGTIVKPISNQFGPDSVTLIHRRELCVPSLKNPGTTTTTTVQAPTTTSATGPVTTVTTSTVTTSTVVATTSTSSSPTTSSTSTTLYGSPSRAFVESVRSLLD